MADKAPSTDTPEENPPQKVGLMTLIKAIAFIAVVVVIEVAGASMLFPTAEETRKIGEKLATADLSDNSGEDDENPDPTVQQLEEMKEVSLGAYHVLRYDPETSSSLNITFELYAVVLAEEEANFNQLYHVNQKRIDEQITITMRAMEVSDLTDPGLGLIKRKILEKTNRALGKPLVREAIFSKFSFVER
jgi:flagellar FliL protein